MTIERRRSPRERRLNSDLKALQQLARESDIIDFEARGNPPEVYRVFFRGNGLWKAHESTDVLVRDTHEVTITLTSAYPRMIPELAWQTPIFHPNISASGVVCLGGYGTHWVPSLMLDELCHMLWDMIRYKNFDIESPYNREAAVWTKQQAGYVFPVDNRPLRNQIEKEKVVPETSQQELQAASGMQPDVQFLDPVSPNSTASNSSTANSQTPGSVPAADEKNGDNDIMFIE